MRTIIDCILDDDITCALKQLSRAAKKHKTSFCILFDEAKSSDTPSCSLVEIIHPSPKIETCGDCPYFVPDSIVQDLLSTEQHVNKILEFIEESKEK